jgi:hypothetical protein
VILIGWGQCSRNHPDRGLAGQHQSGLSIIGLFAPQNSPAVRYIRSVVATLRHPFGHLQMQLPTPTSPWVDMSWRAQLGRERKMTDPTSRANNPQMGDDFVSVYEATAHRITGPVSNIALDLVGVGPGTRILDIAAGAGALSGPATERGATVLRQTLRPVWSGGSRNGSVHSIDAGSGNGRTGSHCSGRKFRCCILDLWRDAVFRLAPRSARTGSCASLRWQRLRCHLG